MTEIKGPEVVRLQQAVNDYITLYTATNPLRPYKNPLPKKITPKIDALATLVKVLGTPEQVVESIFQNPPTVVVDVGKFWYRYLHSEKKRKEKFAAEAKNNRESEVQQKTKNKRSKLLKSLLQAAPIVKKRLTTKPIVVEDAPEDKLYLTKPIHFTNSADSRTRMIISEFIRECQVFLATPIINRDTFTNHEDRRNFEFGVKEAMNHLGQEWSDKFQQNWDNQRITKNKQHLITQGFSALMTRFRSEVTLSRDLVDSLMTFVESFTPLIEEAMKLISAKQTENSYPIIMDVCKGFIDYFSDESNPGNTTGTKLTNHQKEILLKLLETRGVQTLDTDENEFLLQLAENAFGFRIEKIYPFIWELMQYSSREFLHFLDRIRALGKIEDIDLEKISESDKATVYIIYNFLLKAMESPNIEQKPTREDIIDLKQPSVSMPEELALIIAQVIYKSVQEIIADEPVQDSILPKVFFHHFTGENVTLDYLKASNKKD
ncbi:hypothetical protein HZA76_00110 [Candidatus Roizmanbacteria bacterium]|nr:hypothetical protein [Candidatus Roizmanbacteria bacterium]